MSKTVFWYNVIRLQMTKDLQNFAYFMVNFFFTFLKFGPTLFIINPSLHNIKLLQEIRSNRNCFKNKIGQF